jgi:hypothetical protein
MIQIVLIFLLVVMLLGVGGKWLRPPRRSGPPIEAATRCPTCRTYVVGKAPAACARSDCPYQRAG